MASDILREIDLSDADKRPNLLEAGLTMMAGRGGAVGTEELADYCSGIMACLDDNPAENLSEGTDAFRDGASMASLSLEREEMSEDEIRAFVNQERAKAEEAENVNS